MKHAPPWETRARNLGELQNPNSCGKCRELRGWWADDEMEVNVFTVSYPPGRRDKFFHDFHAYQ
jgi:hypothetical protein